MEKTYRGKIRKIIIGQDPKNAMAYELGRVFSTPSGVMKIVMIEEDQNDFYFFGNVRYNIWVEMADKSQHLWKFYEKMPVSVEYEI